MKFLFLSKRCPMGRDLLKSPYGRFYYLPKLLAKKGHEVWILFLDYQLKYQTIYYKDAYKWIPINIHIAGFLDYAKKSIHLVKEIKPDWIIGLSDTYYGILATCLGKFFKVKSAIDAYDNYESYISWLKPLHYLWRRALFDADVVTAAGPQLSDYMKKYRPRSLVYVVPMAADPIGFLPLDQEKSRKAIGLPLSKKIIGYCGSVHKNRGIEVAFQAFEIVNKHRQDVFMVLSGRKDRSIKIPPKISWLGYLPDRLMPKLLNAMNVLLVTNRVSAFGRFSYPVKLYEAMNCQIPVVATSTDATRWILGNKEAHLAIPDDPFDLAKKIMAMLDVNKVNYGKCSSWEVSSDLFETALSPCRP